MSNAIQSTATDEFVTANLDWTAGTWGLMAVTDAYVYDSGHQFLADVGDRIDTVALTGRAVSGGVLTADDVTVPSTAGLSLGGFWVYVDTGSDSTRLLVFWFDTNSDGTPIGGITTADGIVVPWPSGVVAQFAAVPV